MFSRGLQHSLPPVGLLRSREGLLIINGNHRLVVAHHFNASLEGVIYRMGETMNTSADPIKLSRGIIKATRLSRRLATENGIFTVADLHDRTYPPDR